MILCVSHKISFSFYWNCARAQLKHNNINILMLIILLLHVHRLCNIHVTLKNCCSFLLWLFSAPIPTIFFFLFFSEFFDFPLKFSFISFSFTLILFNRNCGRNHWKGLNRQTTKQCSFYTPFATAIAFYFQCFFTNVHTYI